MDNNWLVWADRRNKLDAFYTHTTHTDIYAYDLTHGVERPIVVAPGAQINPNVHGSAFAFIYRTHP